MRYSFFILICVTVIGCTAIKNNNRNIAEELTTDTFRLFDVQRQREIPIAVNKARDEKKLQAKNLVIFSHGYGQNKGGDYLQYSSLTHYLASKGYFVVSIQHELPTDQPMPLSGVPQVMRRPFWERGCENINYVINHLKRSNAELNFEHITLIGHSNGGDMIALFPQKYPGVAEKIITLDNRRMALPKHRQLKVYSLRSSDQPADNGVLPTEDEQKEFGMKIIKVNVPHNNMDDKGSEKERRTIRKYVGEFLSE